jgi:hypothetical protein
MNAKQMAKKVISLISMWAFINPAQTGPSSANLFICWRVLLTDAGALPA